MGNSPVKGKSTRIGIKDFQSVVPFPGQAQVNTEPSFTCRQALSVPQKLPAINSYTGKGHDSHEPHASTGGHLLEKSLPIIPISNSKDESRVTKTRNEVGFALTEGQERRSMIEDCETECSEILEYLFIGSAKVASNLDILQKNGITCIVNCCSMVVPDYFKGDSSFAYLDLNLLDGGFEDISWFCSDVVNFIETSRLINKKVLMHCERGISRSCALAIAYIICVSGESWKEAFDYVKARRAVCAPNVGFMCNLIEIYDLLHGESRNLCVIFRCASHMPHDAATPVLKLCRSATNRKILTPSTSLLDPRGVFVLRPNKSIRSRIYVWQGSFASDAVVRVAVSLSKKMFNIFSSANSVEIVREGSEPPEFMAALVQDGRHSPRTKVTFDDLYTATHLASTDPTKSNCTPPGACKYSSSPDGSKDASPMSSLPNLKRLSSERGDQEVTIRTQFHPELMASSRVGEVRETARDVSGSYRRTVAFPVDKGSVSGMVDLTLSSPPPLRPRPPSVTKEESSYRRGAYANAGAPRPHSSSISDGSDLSDTELPVRQVTQSSIAVAPLALTKTTYSQGVLEIPSPLSALQRPPSFRNHLSPVVIRRASTCPGSLEDSVLDLPSTAFLAPTDGYKIMDPEISDSAKRTGDLTQDPSQEVKPRLFCATRTSSLSPSSVERSGVGWVWRDLGIYDDDDLEENHVLFLWKPVPPYFVWVGRDSALGSPPVPPVPEAEGLRGEKRLHVSDTVDDAASSPAARASDDKTRSWLRTVSGRELERQVGGGWSWLVALQRDTTIVRHCAADLMISLSCGVDRRPGLGVKVRPSGRRLRLASSPRNWFHATEREEVCKAMTRIQYQWPRVFDQREKWSRPSSRLPEVLSLDKTVVFNI